MTDKYLYAIIDALGTCWIIVDGHTEKVQGLPWLIRQGWKPIRETPYMISGYILIFLERD